MKPDKQPKMRGGSDSELTRFKLLWRDSMSESARGFWRELFLSQTTQADIRKQILAKLKIRLDWDKQLCVFRDWEADQVKRAAREERALENERRIIAEHPDWTLDQVRDEVLKQSYFETLAVGDFKLGLATSREHRGVKEQNLAEAKFQFDATKAALAKLDSLKAIRNNSKLSEDEKLEQARLELFGTAPK